MPEMSAILYRSPSNAPLSKVTFARAGAKLPALTEAQQQDGEQALLGIVQASMTYLNQVLSRATLLLASTIFRCKRG